ncbi:MAG: hypothetical protein H7834_07270 [Magnetococcus sp. YQC-9]
MPFLTCSQCGFPLPADNPAPHCRQCGAPVGHAGSFLPSMAMEIYLDHAQESDPDRYLGFDAARVRHFEAFLRRQGISPRSAGMQPIQEFLRQIRDRLGTDGARGYEATLMEFFKALTLKNLIPANPMDHEQREVYTPLDTRGFSEELVTFVTQQEGTGFTENLFFDVRRIQVWEAFLARRDKGVRLAEGKDLSDFMAMARKNFTPKQACGLALTLEELYRVMVQSDLMTETPECAEFIGCREKLERILTTEDSPESEIRLKPLPDGIHGLLRNRRLLFIIGAGSVLLLVGGVLVWQLVNTHPQPGTLQHDVRQKAKEIKHNLSEQPAPARPAAESPFAAPNPPGQSPAPPVKTAIAPTPGVSPPGAPPPGIHSPGAPSPAQPVKIAIAATPGAPTPGALPPHSPGAKPSPPPGMPTPTAQSGTPVQPTMPGNPPKGALPAAVMPPGSPNPMAVVPLKPEGTVPATATPNPPPGGTASLTQPKPDTARTKPADVTTTRLIGCVEGNCENGVGTFIHDDGARYVGQWRNGKKHGAGEFRFSTGGGYRGIWQNGHVTRIE